MLNPEQNMKKQVMDAHKNYALALVCNYALLYACIRFRRQQLRVRGRDAVEW